MDVVCFNLIHVCEPERKFLRGNFIYPQTFCMKSAERKSPNKYFRHISFFFDMSDMIKMRILKRNSSHKRVQLSIITQLLDTCEVVVV